MIIVNYENLVLTNIHLFNKGYHYRIYDSKFKYFLSLLIKSTEKSYYKQYNY
jgi:hypothetical protein